VGNEVRLADLAVRIGARLVGDGEVVVTGISPIEEAGPGQVTFLSNPKYVRYAKDSKASAIIAREVVPGAQPAFLLSDNPYFAFACAVEVFHPPARPAPGVSDKAVVEPSARLGRDVAVSPFVVIQEGAEVGDRTVLFPGVCVGKGVSIGPDCLVYPNVVLYHGVKVGSRVILHAGCVIGSDGFGFAPTPDGYRKIPQVGTVEIEDDVEIGANTTIDRATLGVTRVSRGTKLDNLVQVGHNVVIGRDTVIAALVRDRREHADRQPRHDRRPGGACRPSRGGGRHHAGSEVRCSRHAARLGIPNLVGSSGDAAPDLAPDGGPASEAAGTLPPREAAGGRQTTEGEIGTCSLAGRS